MVLQAVGTAETCDQHLAQWPTGLAVIAVVNI